MCLATVTFGVSTHSHPKAAAARRSSGRSVTPVSTHSRAEAAALSALPRLSTARFNTQPRGGGCPLFSDAQRLIDEFQHTAARRRLLLDSLCFSYFCLVSTHSRAEAAAWSYLMQFNQRGPVSTHSRAEAAA